VIAKCLDGDRAELSDDLTDRLVGAAAEVPVLAALLKAIEEKGRGYDAGRPSDGVMELLRHILDAVATTVPANLESALRNLAKAITEMSPETVANLLSTRASGRAFDNGAQTLDAIVSQMSDEAIAGFVARHANADDSSLARVAQAFGTLVRDDEHGERLLTLAHDQAAHMPFGSEPQFGERWDQVAQRMLTSYSDRPFVSDAYARELMATRTQAIQVDQISDDPPERLKAWLDTVATSELRRLDLLLVNDLLRIESDSDRWAALMPPAVSLIEDLLLVGDLDAAEELLHAITGEAGTSGAPERAAAARRALDALTSGPIVRHMTRFLAEATAEQFDRVRAFCTAFGHALVHPVGEALMTEERPAARERLATILIGFGPAARREAHRLVTSPSATIRRIGVQILREAAGEESLGELRPLLSDPEPQIQRDVVRAILKVGTTAAFEMLQTALANPASSSHEAVMKAVNAHDERTVALFVHILDHVDHRGPLAATYASALDALGVLKNPAGVPSLKSALYRGEWWAPRRTRALREAAADALARIGTPDALAVLDEAGSSGPRGVRAAVRASAQRRPARGPR
jgi:HEAT repeat protein